jgi:hypothetical protein
MGLTGDTLVRLESGYDLSMCQLTSYWDRNHIDLRVFTVQEPWFPVAVAGNTMAGLIIGSRASHFRVSRRNQPVAYLQLRHAFVRENDPEVPFGSPNIHEFLMDTDNPDLVQTQAPKLVKCGETQLVMLIDGRWRAAKDLRPGMQLRTLSTEILPGTNPDLPAIPEGHSISVSAVKYPEVWVESVTMPGEYADLYGFSSLRWFNMALSARIFVHDGG